IAKPSTRICRASMASRLEGAVYQLRAKKGPGDLPWPFHACLLVLRFDEAWETNLAVGDFRRPHGDLLAVLPLRDHAGDEPLAVFEAMGELVILAVELDAADRAFPVGLLQRRDELV